MGTRAVDYDDLLLEEATDLRKGVKVSFDGEDGELDLIPVTYDALREMLLHRDPSGVREVFAPKTRNGDRRSKEEMDHIRAVARAAVDQNGDPMFDIKNTGRLSHDVIEWFENEYEPAQAAAAVNTAEAAEPEAEATPTRGRRRS